MGSHGLEWTVEIGEVNVIRVKMENSVKHIDWHIKGDYLVTVSPDSAKKNEVVWVHSIQKGVS
jgi:hypothetical protein